jgi:peptidoglycan hydrolase-like protein with peptidoglycan-binding domain
MATNEKSYELSKGVYLREIPPSGEDYLDWSAKPETTLLRQGSTGLNVAELQRNLKRLGFYIGAIDGKYREETLSAVREFQKAEGLSPTGETDVSTWNKFKLN